MENNIFSVGFRAQLKQLQNGRREAKEKALEDAMKIRNLKQALNESWQPDSDGFEFSSAHLTAWIERRKLLEQARGHHDHGRLPDPAPQTTHVTQL